jgi:phosphoribosylamine--glycine ligase
MGVEITGIEEAAAMPGVTVFHAGTRRLGDGSIVTAGGRVLGVTAKGVDLDEARARAYAACEVIQFDGKTLRRDIGAAAAPARR